MTTSERDSGPPAKKTDGLGHEKALSPFGWLWSRLKLSLKEFLRPEASPALIVLTGGIFVATAFFARWLVGESGAELELFATIAQVDAGLLVAFAVETRIGHRGERELSSFGAAAASLSLVTAIAGLVFAREADPGASIDWLLLVANVMPGAISILAMFFGAGLLVIRLMVPSQSASDAASEIS
jgi:hypothetical protein